MNRRNAFYYSLTVLLVALMFVWPMGRTIALRLVLFFSALACAGWLIRLEGRQVVAADSLCVKAPFYLWLALSAWILVGALTFAADPAKVLIELRGQWLRGGLAGLLGFLAASLALRGRSPVSPPLLFTLIVAPMFLQTLLQDVYSLWLWRDNGSLPYDQTLFIEGKAKVSYVTNTALSIVCAELMARLAFARRFLPIASRWLAALVPLLLLCLYLLGARNGVIGAVLLFLSCLVFYGIAQRKRMHGAVLALFLALGVSGVAGFAWVAEKADLRWQSFVQTVPLALDTVTHRAWLNPQLYPYPPLADGRPVDISAYERLAWIKEGALLLKDHPLGFGFSRTAFSDGLVAKYPGEALPGAHSHSGLLDIALGTGVPGLLMWFGMIACLFVLGWRGFFRHHHPAGLALLFVLMGFFGRSLIDSNLRDHMLEQSFFLCGLLAAFALPQNKNEP
ncbi:MAG: O-antigen ligase family protein [Sulfuricella sp.]|nr:O-antigen ligase family protein [Sulfuricella sp.]